MMPLTDYTLTVQVGALKEDNARLLSLVRDMRDALEPFKLAWEWYSDALQLQEYVELKLPGDHPVMDDYRKAVLLSARADEMLKGAKS